MVSSELVVVVQNKGKATNENRAHQRFNMDEFRYLSKNLMLK
jgi:hypothetical protein